MAKHINCHIGELEHWKIELMTEKEDKEKQREKVMEVIPPPFCCNEPMKAYPRDRRFRCNTCSRRIGKFQKAKKKKMWYWWIETISLFKTVNFFSDDNELMQLENLGVIGLDCRQNPMKGGVGFYWKKRDISPPLWPPPLFLGKKFFFRFSEKFSKFFFNEIGCKKFVKQILHSEWVLIYLFPQKKCFF